MTTIKEILAEFDEKFKKSDGWNPSSIGSALESEIKSFISSSHSHLIEEIIKMVKKLERTPANLIDGIPARDNYFFNLALFAIITNLSTLNE